MGASAGAARLEGKGKALSGTSAQQLVRKVRSERQYNMRKFRDIIDHLLRQIGVDKELICHRKYGETRDFEIQVGERVDVTDTSVKAAEARVIRNGHLIEVYKKKDVAPWTSA